MNNLESQGWQFWLDYSGKTGRRNKQHNGNVIALHEDAPTFLGKRECLAAVYYHRNSAVASDAVTPEYLADFCEPISEARARRIHPAMFDRLDDNE